MTAVSTGISRFTMRVFLLTLILSVAKAADYSILPLSDNVATCSPENQCRQCEGDCFSDADCEGDLVCFKKDRGPSDDPDFIPSCKGIDTSRTDWCVVDIRAGNPELGNPIIERKKVRDCTNGPACSRCEGHCAGDNECEGDLICFKKDGRGVPGCEGQDFSSTDWCVDPIDVTPTEPSPNSPQGNSDPSSGNSRSATGGDLMIMAYYYTWYINDDWSRHGLQGNVPSEGYYGSDNVTLCELHNKWAKRAGIDAWVVSWWGRDHMSDDFFFAGLMQASNFLDVQFSMLYELGALVSNDFSNPKTLAGMISDLKYYRRHFFHLSNYVYVDGRPMVTLYLTRNYKNFKPWMLEKIYSEVGDIFFVADTPYFGHNVKPRGASNGEIGDSGEFVFEAYTSYNMFTNPRVIDGEKATDYMFREGLPIFNAWANRVTYFPQILPMYHDFRGHGQLVGDAKDMRKQLERFSCLNKPMGDKFPNILFMTSWNEWWEGSQLEPDMAGKYGFTFIDELRRFRDVGPANC